MPDQYAPDGSPVEFYTLMPALGEAEVIHAALPPGCDIMELGCGAGRITRPLRALGHRVVAVDQSAAMLAHLAHRETVCSDIETLALGRAFPGVVLASQLVNTAYLRQRAAFLATCRRHLAQGGDVLLQRLDPVWAASGGETHGEREGVSISVRDARRAGDLVSAVTVYTVGERRWEQPWALRMLADNEFGAALTAASLGLRQWLTDSHMWAEATTR